MPADYEKHECYLLIKIKKKQYSNVLSPIIISIFTLSL